MPKLTIKIDLCAQDYRTLQREVAECAAHNVPLTLDQAARRAIMSGIWDMRRTHTLADAVNATLKTGIAAEAKT